MNNQRRHELERNVLAEKMGKGYEQVQPALKPALVLAIVGLLGFLGYQFFKGSSSAESAARWSEFYYAREGGNADSFAELADLFPNKPTGLWAKHSAAQGYLRDGVDALYVNRKEGVDNIRKAIDLWKPLKSSEISELRNLATLGLAQAHESLGELDDAIKNYQIVADLPTASEPQKQRFNEQINYLKSADAKNFYEWFNKLDPKPAASPIFSGDLKLPPTSPSISLDPNVPSVNTPVVPPNNPTPSAQPGPATAPDGTAPITPPATPADSPAATPGTPAVTPAETPATPPAATPSASGTQTPPATESPTSPPTTEPPK